MAEQKQETSLFQDVIKAVSIPGDLARQYIKETITGDIERGAVKKIIKGEKTMYAGEFVNFLEKQTGLDLTAGDGSENDTFMDGAKNFVRDVAVDIFTSPDSVLGIPAKLAKTLPIINTIKNPMLRKGIERGVQGATLGALAIQPDDDKMEALGKILAGAATLGASPIAFKGLRSGANYVTTNAIDPLIRNHHKGAYKPFLDKGIDLGYIEAAEIVRLSNKKYGPFKKLYYDQVKNVIDDYANNLLKQGMPPEQVKQQVIQFATLLQKNYGKQVATRTNVKSMLKAARDGDYKLLKQGQMKYHADMTQEFGKEHADKMIKNSLLDMKERAMTGQLAKGTPDEALGKAATDFTNKHYADAVLDVKLKNDPVLRSAVNQYMKMNDEMIAVHNAWAEQAFKKGDLVKSTAFTPIRFWTPDLRKMDDVIDEDILGSFKEGPRQRFGDVVGTLENAKGLGIEDFAEIGSDRFARYFLTTNELQARALVTKVGKSIRDDKSLVGGMLRGYDNLLGLVKTGHLTTSFNWLINNFSDNLLRSYMASGPMAAMKVAGNSVAGSAHALGNWVFGGKALDNFLTDTSFKKIFDASNPMLKKGAVKYNNEWMKTASHYGVIDDDIFKSMARIADENAGLLEFRKGTREFKAIEKALAERPEWMKASEKMQEFMWDTVGRYGGAIEGTARYETFRAVTKSLRDKFPEGYKLIKENKNALKMLRQPDIEIAKGLGKFPGTKGGGKQVSIKALDQARDLLEEASSITRNTFFDYKDVRAFDQYVMKRIFPYWTFFSRNFQYWIDNFADPNKIAKVSNMFKIFRNTGRPPNEVEQLGIPEYFKEVGAGIKDKGRSGIELRTVPNLSIIDAMKMMPFQPSRALRSSGERLSPLIKEPIQQFFNIDMFTGGPLVPSESSPRKRIFESALTGLPDKALEAMGIYRDSKTGKMVTNSAAAARLASASRSYVPLPFLDAMARAKKKTRFTPHGPRKAEDVNIDRFVIEAVKQFSPLKTKQLSGRDIRREAKRRKRSLKRLHGGKKELGVK